jgi:hypothetical protein
VEPEEVVDRSVSRRNLLKGAAIGGAAAWGAPLIMTGTAYAGKFNKKCADVAVATGGPGCAICTGLPACGVGGATCFCFVTAAGCCFCANNAACSSLTPCRTKRDCPRGWDCAYTCCGGLTCNPPCAQISAVPAGYSGKTNSGVA